MVNPRFRMVKRNPNIAKLPAGYLFPEIGRRRRALLEKHPDAKVISLGIGNTTEPLTPHIAAGLRDAAVRLGTPEGYSGYDDDPRGQALLQNLKAKISEKWYRGRIAPEEIYISDGAKCDCSRLQILFGAGVSIAVQDPAYPVYVDGSVMIGATGAHDPDRGQFEGLAYLPCTPDNGFFPDLSAAPRTDLIYFCSPNNPTGAVSTREQLKRLVDFAKRNGSIVIFDAAYAAYIRDDRLPRSVFEIEAAREVALEVNSFSKSIGFTGVRLGWTAIPKELAFIDGTPVGKDWGRVTSTVFNGASNIAQYGGLAALDDEGLAEMRGTVGYYMENARIIKAGLTGLGWKSYGGVDSPYVWAEFPGRKSWDVFTEILEKAHVVTTPGSGFGPAGEGFLRFSAFGHRADVEEAVARLKERL
ncbi:MAG: LL-diaminopimelate aminotransferase [Anaerolineales bacterium]|nr:LL-diaminopimelate aminotransferase [Anaerolineales bacterium]